MVDFALMLSCLSCLAYLRAEYVVVIFTHPPRLVNRRDGILARHDYTTTIHHNPPPFKRAHAEDSEDSETDDFIPTKADEVS